MRGMIGDERNRPPVYPPGSEYDDDVPVPMVDSSCDCVKCEARSSEFYVVRGSCTNCGAKFRVKSRKGDQTPLSVECPVCEVTVYGWRRL